MKKEDIEFLMELQHKLNTQGSDGNADPLFWGVMERKKVPAPSDSYDGIELFDGEDSYDENQLNELKEWMRDSLEFSEPALEDIEDLYAAQELLDRAGYSAEIVYYRYEDSLSTDTGAFLTKEACQNHIKINGHNLCNPYTYAMTAYRNFEYGQLLQILKTANFRAFDTSIRVKIKDKDALGKIPWLNVKKYLLKTGWEKVHAVRGGSIWRHPNVEELYDDAGLYEIHLPEDSNLGDYNNRMADIFDILEFAGDKSQLELYETIMSHNDNGGKVL